MESNYDSEFVQTVNGVSFKMMLVQAGTFIMGATPEQECEAYDEEKPAHSVTLTNDYYIGEFVVTQKLWKAVMGNNPSHLKGDDLPVVEVSWDDSKKFINRLNDITGKKFRLPTEAEWEFAARGGNMSKGYKYSGSNNIDEVAWHYDSSHEEVPSKVGLLVPNELGIYDMSGNVFEWCEDKYGEYSTDTQINPSGDSSNSNRVMRGGSLNYDSRDCRVSYRNFYFPFITRSFVGFRLAMTRQNKKNKIMAAEEKKEIGYVYILTNPSFDGSWIKFGQAKDVEERIKVLNTGAPFKFEKYATLQTSKYKKVENFIHKFIKEFSNIPTADSKEFYKIEPSRALDMFYLVANIVDGCKIELFDYNAKKYRKDNFKFFMVGLQVGDKIIFKPLNIIVDIVDDENKISYNNKIYTLSGFAKEFMPTDKRTDRKYQGPLYFTYLGELLTDMRKRIEGENAKNNDLEAESSLKE